MTIWGPFGFGDPSVKTSKVPAGLPAAVEQPGLSESSQMLPRG